MMSRRRGSSHSNSDRATKRAGNILWHGSGDGAPSNARSASEASGSASDGWIRHGTALPDWTDLETVKNRRRQESGGALLEHVSTLRFALVILAIAGTFTLYVGHVHATTNLYNELQQARKENQQLHLKHNRLKGAYDRRTGPSVIYERARELGLQESVTYGPPITVD
jgi:hypothetical protein